MKKQKFGLRGTKGGGGSPCPAVVLPGDRLVLVLCVAVGDRSGSPAGSDTDVSEMGIVQGHAYGILQVCLSDHHHASSYRTMGLARTVPIHVVVGLPWA